MKTIINTLVIGGGGFKGVAYCGVLKKINELKASNSGIKVDIKNVCCVSVGAVFGLLYLLNYQYDEIKDEIVNKDFNMLKNIKLVNLIKEYGLDDGKNIITWLETLVLKKGYSKDITFIELYETTNVNLQIVATNLNKYLLTIFDHTTAPNLKITDAIRMSMSLPFIFTKQYYKDDIYIDGGIINNYPIELFKNNLDNVLGIKLIGGNKVEDRYEIDKMDNYIYNIISCFIKYKEINTNFLDKYIKHTICIYTNNITSTIKFDISKKDKKKLMNLGYDAADEYFRNILDEK